MYISQLKSVGVFRWGEPVVSAALVDVLTPMPSRTPEQARHPIDRHSLSVRSHALCRGL